MSDTRRFTVIWELSAISSIEEGMSTKDLKEKLRAMFFLDALKMGKVIVCSDIGYYEAEVHTVRLFTLEFDGYEVHRGFDPKEYGDIDDYIEALYSFTGTLEDFEKEVQ